MSERAAIDRFGAIRSSFPGASNGPYMDVSARSLLYGGARAALDQYLDANAAGRLNKTEMFAAIERTRSLYAQLIGADPDEVAYTRNVTDGIATFAASLPWERGDNVVVCEALEHPANVLPWYGLRSRFGVNVKTVAPSLGHIPLDGVLAAVDGRTRVVSVSAVTFAPGLCAMLMAADAVSAGCAPEGVPSEVAVVNSV